MNPSERERFGALVARGRELYRAGRFAESRDVLREALLFGEQSFGLEAVELIDALRVLAHAIDEKTYEGPSPETLALHQRMLAIAEAACGPDDMQTSGALYYLGLDLWALERDEEALAHVRRALAIALRKLDDEHHFVREVRAALGAKLVEAGYPQEAIPLLERERELADEDRHEASRMIAHRSLGLALLRAGRSSEAARRLETSIALAEAMTGGNVELVREMREWLDEANSGSTPGASRR